MTIDVDKGLTPYTILAKDGQWRAGINQVFESQTEDLWLPDVSVVDSDVMAAKALQLGGEVLVKTGSMPSNVRAALITDPQGAILMVENWSFKGGQP